MKACIFSHIKDEHEYLEDFIRYHIDIGINKIFLFEDIGSISHKEICGKYPENVILSPITLLFTEKEINKHRRLNDYQKEGIKRGIKYIRDNYDFDWCFAIDGDEYVTVKKPLNKILPLYEQYDAIKLQWQNFGYSGYIKKPIHDKPIYEIFTKECGYAESDKQFHNTTKMCYNLSRFNEDFVIGLHNAACNYVKPDFTRDDNTFVFGDIYIRHYITKSFEEYFWKIHKRGSLQPGHTVLHFYEMNRGSADDIYRTYGTTEDTILYERIFNKPMVLNHE